jgi:hypothetical protein
MEKKKAILLGYLIIIFIKIIIRNFSLSSLLSFGTIVNLISWFLGGLIGWYLLYLDQVIWVYFTHPDKDLSFNVKHLADEGDYKKAFLYLKNNRTYQKHLAFRNLYFQVAWIVLTLFTITTAVTLLGKAIVMSIGLHLLIEEWNSYQEKGHFNWLFWQMDKKLNSEGQKVYFVLIVSIFILFSLML